VTVAEEALGGVAHGREGAVYADEAVHDRRVQLPWVLGAKIKVPSRRVVALAAPNTKQRPISCARSLRQSTAHRCPY
jgi:hypothetical protein